MSNERFTLTPSANSMWTVSDKETGFSITFREGMFNETQEVKNPDKLPQGVDLAAWSARAMSAIGDYMAQEHPFIATCDIYARRSALWTLSHESWWVTLVAACNSLLIDEEEGDLTLSCSWSLTISSTSRMRTLPTWKTMRKATSWEPSHYSTKMKQPRCSASFTPSGMNTMTMVSTPKNGHATCYGGRHGLTLSSTD